MLSDYGIHELDKTLSHADTLKMDKDKDRLIASWIYQHQTSSLNKKRTVRPSGDLRTTILDSSCGPREEALEVE